MDLLVCGVKIQRVLSAFAVFSGSQTFILIYGFSLLTQLAEVYHLRSTELSKIIIQLLESSRAFPH
jgi:hypothetical protein